MLLNYALLAEMQDEAYIIDRQSAIQTAGRSSLDISRDCIHSKGGRIVEKVKKNRPKFGSVLQRVGIEI